MPSNYKDKLAKKGVRIYEKYPLAESLKHTYIETEIMQAHQMGFNSLMEQTIKLAESLERIVGTVEFNAIGDAVESDSSLEARDTLKFFNSWLEGK